MGAYTTEWPEQPHLANYALAARRAHQAAEAAARAVEVVEQRTQPAPEADAADDGGDWPDASFHSAIMTRGRVPVRATARGRGRGGVAMQQRRREALVAFAGEIIATLPIKFREEQVRLSAFSAGVASAAFGFEVELISTAASSRDGAGHRRVAAGSERLVRPRYVTALTPAGAVSPRHDAHADDLQSQTSSRAPRRPCPRIASTRRASHSSAPSMCALGRLVETDFSRPSS